MNVLLRKIFGFQTAPCPAPRRPADALSLFAPGFCMALDRECANQRDAMIEARAFEIRWDVADDKFLVTVEFRSSPRHQFLVASAQECLNWHDTNAFGKAYETVRSRLRVGLEESRRVAQ